jgi:hypothetical protein
MPEAPRKPYEPPTIKKLTAKQAKLLLFYNARVGDQNAAEILKLITPEPPAKN